MSDVEHIYWRYGKHGVFVQSKINRAKVAGNKVILFVHIRVIKHMNDKSSSILHMIPTHARRLCDVVIFYNGSQEMILKNRFSDTFDSEPARTMFRGDMIKLTKEFKVNIEV